MRSNDRTARNSSCRKDTLSTRSTAASSATIRQWNLAHAHWRVPPPSFSLKLDARPARRQRFAIELGRFQLTRLHVRGPTKNPAPPRSPGHSLHCCLAQRAQSSYQSIFPAFSHCDCLFDRTTSERTPTTSRTQFIKTISTTPCISYHRLKAVRKGQLRSTCARAQKNPIRPRWHEAYRARVYVHRALICGGSAPSTEFGFDPTGPSNDPGLASMQAVRQTVPRRCQ